MSRNRRPFSTKREANIKQAFSCIGHALKDTETLGTTLNETEWKTLIGIALYVGQLNALHHKNDRKNNAS